MSQQGSERPADDPVRPVAEVSLRLMAGVVSRKLMDTLQRTVRQNPAEYPWQVVNQAVLAETVDPARLVQQGLRAQRDWIVRGGRENPSRPLGLRAKTLLAMVLSRLLFFAAYTAAVAVLLLLLKQKWPGLDLYRILYWLQAALPGVFPPPG
jgi:hypothetical protein